MALRVGPSTPASPAVIAGKRYSGHRAGPRSALTASPQDEAARPSSTTISSRRRSVASITAPPSSEQMSSGNSWARLTSPTCSDEWVSSYTWKGTATAVSWVPRTEIICPLMSHRKSRLRRSGVRSIRRRRRTPGRLRGRRRGPARPAGFGHLPDPADPGLGRRHHRGGDLVDQLEAEAPGDAGRGLVVAVVVDLHPGDARLGQGHGDELPHGGGDDPPPGVGPIQPVADLP